MYTSQRFPPNLRYVATLPCEDQKSKNVTDFDSTSIECLRIPVNSLRT